MWKESGFTGIIMGLIILCLLAGCESFFIFHPDKFLAATPGQAGLDFETINIPAEDGNMISAWWVPCKNERGVVLFCHGNAGNISHCLDSIRIFNQLGLGVFIFDYRGFGNSTGSPSEEGTYSDASVSWEYLVNIRKTPQEKIIAWGRSLGGAVAIWLAKNKKVAAVIAESSFTSVADVSERHAPVLPGSLIFGGCYNSLDLIGSIKVPVLIIHSPDDEVIPYGHGERLFERANEPKQFLKISGSHNTGFMESANIYKDGIDIFIKRYMP